MISNVSEVFRKPFTRKKQRKSLKDASEGVHFLGKMQLEYFQLYQNRAL